MAIPRKAPTPWYRSLNVKTMAAVPKLKLFKWTIGIMVGSLALFIVLPQMRKSHRYNSQIQFAEELRRQGGSTGEISDANTFRKFKPKEDYGFDFDSKYKD
jgi:hypothetical protein